jgi:Amt family ammonium transporter
VVSSLIYVLWAVYGYSLAFGGGAIVHRQSGQAVPEGRHARLAGRTFSKGVVIPELIVHRLPGHVCRHHLRADRGCVRRARQVLGHAAVLVIWFTFSYLPIAHMVWYWGPDAITGQGKPAAMPAGCGQGRAGLRRRHRGAHQRRVWPVWWVPT